MWPCWKRAWPSTRACSARRVWRKFQSTIASLERQLAEATKKRDHTAAGASTQAAPAQAQAPTNALASHFAYPSQFEANLAQFLSEHVDDSNAEEEAEVWGWADFPTHSHENTSSAAAAAAATNTTRTLPAATVDKMLKLQLTQPVQLYACPRLGVGLELGFAQFHSLIYLQAVSSMHMQMP
jgi:hypothetical protein